MIFQSIFACVHWVRQVSTKHSCRQLFLGIFVAAVPRRESPRRVGVPQHHGHADTRNKNTNRVPCGLPRNAVHAPAITTHTQNNTDIYSVNFVWYLI